MEGAGWEEQAKTKQREDSQQLEQSLYGRQRYPLLLQVDETFKWDVKNSMQRPMWQPHCVKMLSDEPGR